MKTLWIFFLGLLCLGQSFAKEAPLESSRPVAAWGMDPGKRIERNLAGIFIGYVPSCILKDVSPYHNANFYQSNNPVSVEIGPLWISVIETRQEEGIAKKTEILIPVHCVGNMQLDYKDPIPVAKDSSPALSK